MVNVTENLHAVSIGEMVVSNKPNDILVAYGLGSCVAVCMYDAQARVGGMIHSLLPTSKLNGSSPNTTVAKFVDHGVPLLLETVLGKGASRSRLVVHLCGGAQMLAAPGFSDALNIGKRNVETAEKLLAGLGFRIRAQSTGGHAGRTVRLYIVDGKITVKTLGQDEKVLA